MESNDVVKFFSRSKECRSLSNFWEKDVVIVANEITLAYESGEHCFQGEKFRRLAELCVNATRKEMMCQYAAKFLKPSGLTLAQSKSLGTKRKFPLSADEMANFMGGMAILMQEEICQYKIENYEEVRNDLLESGEKLLIHPALRCSDKATENKFWEGRLVERDGIKVMIGGNTLGAIWMKVRSRIS